MCITIHISRVGIIQEVIVGDGPENSYKLLWPNSIIMSLYIHMYVHSYMLAILYIHSYMLAILYKYVGSLMI